MSAYENFLMFDATSYHLFVIPITASGFCVARNEKKWENCNLTMLLLLQICSKDTRRYYITIQFLTALYLSFVLVSFLFLDLGNYSAKSFYDIMPCQVIFITTHIIFILNCLL